MHLFLPCVALFSALCLTNGKKANVSIFFHFLNNFVQKSKEIQWSWIAIDWNWVFDASIYFWLQPKMRYRCWLFQHWELFRAKFTRQWEICRIHPKITTLTKTFPMLNQCLARNDSRWDPKLCSIYLQTLIEISSHFLATHLTRGWIGNKGKTLRCHALRAALPSK